MLWSLKPDSDRIVTFIRLMPTLGVYLLVAAIASFVVLAVVESVLCLPLVLAVVERCSRLPLCSLIAANST